MPFPEQAKPVAYQLPIAPIAFSLLAAAESTMVDEGAAPAVRLLTADGVEQLSPTQRRLLELAGFDATLGAVCCCADEAGNPSVLLGLGPSGQLTLDSIRLAAAALTRTSVNFAQGLRLELARDLPDMLERVGLAGLVGESVEAFVEGAELGSYRAPQVGVAGQSGRRPARPLMLPGDQLAGARRGQQLASAVNMVRDLVNLPGGVLGPARLAEFAIDYVQDSASSIEVRLRELAELTAAGFGALVAVGQAAVEPPCLLELRYRHPAASRTVALVGKGITFDSGGLNLKPGQEMSSMKNDMAGAATALAALRCAADRELAVNVTAILPIAENAVGPRAIRPGDVVSCRNGMTVEVTDPDCEGRLVLADGLALAVEDRPDLVIDIGTLTGASQVALGPAIGAVMSNRRELAELLCRLSEQQGEQLWQLPLARQYRSRLASPVATLRNSDYQAAGGAVLAGLFLEHFVAGTPWLHLDLDGPAYAAVEHSYGPAGGTGYGVRTLVRALEYWSAR